MTSKFIKSYYLKVFEIFSELEIDLNSFLLYFYILPLYNFILVMEVKNGPKIIFLPYLCLRNKYCIFEHQTRCILLWGQIGFGCHLCGNAFFFHFIGKDYLTIIVIHPGFILLSCIPIAVCFLFFLLKNLYKLILICVYIFLIACPSRPKLWKVFSFQNIKVFCSFYFFDTEIIG